MPTADELLQTAEQSFEQGDFEQAVTLFEQAHDANPQSPDGAIGMARVALMLGGYEDAMVILDRILRFFPKHAAANTYRGVVDEGFGRLEPALKYYEKAAKLDPRLPVARFNLGRCYGQLKRWKAAVRELQVATRQEPGNVAFWYNLGIVCQESGDSAKAIDAFSECVEINPLFVDGHLTLADVLVNAKRERLAEEILDNAAQLFPDEGIIHSKRAAMAARRGDPNGAIERLRQELEVDPENVDAWLNLSIFGMLAEDLEVAEEGAVKAAELEPDGWRAHYQLGMVYDAVGLKDQAKNALETSVANSPDSEWGPRNNLALLLMEETEEKPLLRASALLEEAKTHSPPEETHIALYNLALVHWKLDKKKESQAYARQAAAGPPGDSVTEDAKRFLDNFS